MPDYNETISWVIDSAATLRGVERHPANSEAARAVDRHNNALGSAIGNSAATSEAVVERARQAIARAETWGGSGH